MLLHTLLFGVSAGSAVQCSARLATILTHRWLVQHSAGDITLFLIIFKEVLIMLAFSSQTSDPTGTVIVRQVLRVRQDKRK